MDDSLAPQPPHHRHRRNEVAKARCHKAFRATAKFDNDPKLEMRRRPKFLVLIGDSEDALRESLKLMLPRCLAATYHLEFDHCRYGEDLIGMASRRKYHLFVLVLNNIPFRHPLPDGFTRLARAVDLVSHLRSKYRRPVVALTAWNPRGLGARVEAAGADVFLVTPFHADLFTDLVSTCLSTADHGGSTIFNA